MRVYNVYNVYNVYVYTMYTIYIIGGVPISQPLLKLSKPVEDFKPFDDGEANDEVDADFLYAKDLN